MKYVDESYDLVVCGGGLAGVCAALAAARSGLKTCLIHNRPVLGGNSSSEVGVTPHGAAAFHAYARETGIISELLIEERATNHAEIYENGWTNSVWDMVQYDAAVAEKRLTLYLNTDVHGVVLHGEAPPTQPPTTIAAGFIHRPGAHGKHPGSIRAVKASVQNAEVELTIRGRFFCDATGDARIAHEAGCEWRMGSEGREEFDEPHAPAAASVDTMGSSIHILARDTGRPAPYIAPAWAVHHEDAGFFYDQGRPPKEERGGFWWIEIGVPYHTIYDNETIRHELTRHALGVWDWMKNRDPKMKDRCANYALDWIGQVPGKRESRRVAGLYFMTEHDVQRKTVFEDEVGFGGWFVDLHTPGGLLAKTSEPASAEGNYDPFGEYAVKSYCGPYGFPLRTLIARDVDNLFLAGRCISATHAALGTLRVMSTTALMGQAVGVAAAVAVRNDLPVADLCAGKPLRSIQQQLLADGCFLPNVSNTDDGDLARSAEAVASSEAKLVGAGPTSQGHHAGLSIWKDQPQYAVERLEKRVGQMFAVGHEGVSRVACYLRSDSPQAQRVAAKLVAVTDIWDYRSGPGEPLAETLLDVPAKHDGWISWQLPERMDGLTPGAFLRLDLLPNPQIEWLLAGAVVPGCLAVYEIGGGRMRRFGNGQTLGFQVDPPQSAYPAAGVISGVTRPHRQTNLWRSDPDRPLPQWVELKWDKPVTIDQVRLTFPGHLLREYHAYAPFYRDPQCPADYHVDVCRDGEWHRVAAAVGNYQRHRIHRLDRAVRAESLRVTVTATNGDPSAAIYEVRCGGPKETV